MHPQRTRLAINVGSWLELVGAGSFCVGLGVHFGPWVALIAAGILLVVAAELIYDGTVVRVPLPHKPKRPSVPAGPGRVWRRLMYGKLGPATIWIRVRHLTLRRSRWLRGART